MSTRHRRLTTRRIAKKKLMIRRKEKIKGSTFDRYGRLVDNETELEEITCECVGDILDVLSEYPRSATVFI